MATKTNPAPKAAPVRAAKTVVKTPAKPRAAKKVVTPKVTQPSTAPQASEVKAKKPKLVRDSFTMPKPEYVVIDELKQRAAKLGHPVKKSELLRAAIKVIAGLSDAAFISAMSAVPPIKTGRPSKS
jgi:hypothetical protein